MQVRMAQHLWQRLLEQDRGELFAAVDERIDLLVVRVPEGEEVRHQIVARHAVDEAALVAAHAFAPLVRIAFARQVGAQ
ncbi:hypothetical protein D9M69_592100 [compost metagenome]